MTNFFLRNTTPHMQIINNPPIEVWDRLCRRSLPDDTDIEVSVEETLRDVRDHGDEALFRLARRFDGFNGTSLELSEIEIKEGAANVTPDVAEAIRHAAANIEAFHRAQIPAPVEVTTVSGVRCIQRSVPIEKVGLYIPGGSAPLFSTVLMLVIPARIAGCKEIVLCTPQHGSDPISPAILFAADLCGVSRIFRIGGAQAIAALAYGTESIPAVNKIFGPGNRYVMKAKQMVSRTTSIDMPAGPSEVMVLADHTARPEYIAADMLSQCEHGPDSQAIAICTSVGLAEEVAHSIDLLVAGLSRRDSISRSLANSRIIVLPSRKEMTDFANRYAPEHLIISTDNPWGLADNITAAGSVFIGNFSPESAGDYASGTNHTLPTSGWAVSVSGINTESFMHRITYQELTREGLNTLASTITTMAREEGLDAHALAVTIRRQTDEAN